MKVQLSKLFALDCEVEINNYEVEVNPDIILNGTQCYCCNDGDDNWYFADQEVEFNNGTCNATTVAQTVEKINFFVRRRLSNQDIENL